ncbi:MAG: helix-turn-helix transcriptional regulator [Proteobacteria bacterium]|nr:helix-turn-helix transcriptional regulator [Pseudomonadota bacterium]
MRVPIHTVSDLGLALRATRKAQGVRGDDLAGAAGVGHVFLIDVEHGKDTVQLGRVLRLLDEAGLRLTVDVPTEAEPVLATLRSNGLLRAKRSQRVLADTDGSTDGTASLSGSGADE